MQSNDIDLNELKELEKDILNKVVEFCDKHNLKYMLVFGTLLGAVRHKGFIPWDDDIDIAMPRKDYELFLKLFPGEMKGTIYYLQSSTTEKKYWLPFAKVRRLDTLFNELPIVKVDAPKGVFVDIFPIDELRKETIFTVLKLRLLFLNKTIIYSKRKLDFDNNKKMLYKLLRLFPLGIPTLQKINEALFKKGKGDMIGFFYANETLNRCNYGIPKDEIFPTSKVEFEGKIYNAPKNTDYFLKNFYGDYMKLPPVEKRTTWHPYKGLRYLSEDETAKLRKKYNIE